MSLIWTIYFRASSSNIQCVGPFGLILRRQSYRVNVLKYREIVGKNFTQCIVSSHLEIMVASLNIISTILKMYIIAMTNNVNY